VPLHSATYREPVPTRNPSRGTVRLVGLIVLAWLALPLTLCGWLLYGCWRLLSGVCRLARLAALGLAGRLAPPGASGPSVPPFSRYGH
jgi:hypothetical protein